MTVDILGLNETRLARADIAAMRAALPPLCLPGEVIHIWTSQQWIAPAEGYLRVCAASGGGGTGYKTIPTYMGGGGGASALAFWRWRRVAEGDAITIVLGAAGVNATASVAATNGGITSITAPWGVMTADPGLAGAPSSSLGGGAGGAGGSAGTGGDYYYPGGAGFTLTTSVGAVPQSYAGAAVNPFNLPRAVVSATYMATAMPNGQKIVYARDLIASMQGNNDFDIAVTPTPPPGWLAVITGMSGVGAGPFVSCLSAIDGQYLFQSGVTKAAYGATGAPGFAILEFCMALPEG
jgi:hypothetical protein